MNDDIFKLLDQKYGAQKRQEEEEKKKEGGFDWKDWVSEAGGLAGGLIGTVGGPAGMVGGATIGAGMSQALESRLKGEPITAKKVATESVISGAGELAGLGLAKIGGKLLKPISKFFSKGGDDLAVRGLRANSSQLTKFKSLHGEDVVETLSRHKLQGAGSKEILERAITPLQNSFDDIVKSADIKVSQDVLDKNFYKKIKILLESGDLDDVKAAESIMAQYDNILKETDNSLGSLNKFRKNFDAKYQSYKTGNPLVASEKQIIADALRETVHEGAEAAGATGSKETGRELSKLYDLLKIAEKQENLGRGSLPIGITTAIGGGIGVSVGAVTGGGAGAGAGAIAGSMAAERVVNNPKVIGALSRMATASGDKMMIKALEMSAKSGTPLAGAIGQLSSQALLNDPQPETTPELPNLPQTSNMSGDQQDVLGSFDQVNQALGGGGGQGGGGFQGFSKEQQAKFMLQDLASGGKNIDELTAIFKLLGSGGEEQKKYSDTAITKIADLQSALSNLENLDTLVDENKGFIGPLKGIQAKNPWSKARFAQADIDRVRQQVGKALEGGVLRKEDEEKYKKILPTMSDTYKTAKYKIKALYDAISRDMKDYENKQQTYGTGTNSYLPSNVEDITF